MAYWHSSRRAHRLLLSRIIGAHSSTGVEPMPQLDSVWAVLRRDEEGQGLAEYALILALIAIVAIVALIFLGGKVSTVLSTVGRSI